MPRPAIDWARALVRARGWAILPWLGIGLVLAWFAADAEDVLEVGATVRGSESARLALAVDSLLPTGDAEYAVLVIRGVDPRATSHDQARLDSLAAATQSVPGVTRVRFYQQPRDSLLIGTGGALLLTVLDPVAGPGDRLIPLLREVTAPLATSWRRAGITLRWTGESALNADLRRTSASDAHRAEWRALPVTLVILVLAFGTFVAAGIPLLVGVLTIACALGTACLVGHVLPLSLMLQSLVTMIGLGLGIDYGLLMVTRFREAMREKRCPETAALVAARYGGRTIVVSGLAVLVGFAGLTIVPLGELQSVGFGGLVVVAFAVAISVTLLPGLLAFMGTKIDSFRIVRLGLSRPGGWRRWGFWVCHHPIRVLCVAGSPLLWLAWQGTQTRVGTPREDWLPPAMESARGLQDMIDMERGALLQRTRVLVRLPKGEDALSPKGWQVLRDVRGRLLDDDRIAAVLSFTSFDADRPLSRLRFLGTPRAVRNAYVSEDRRTVLLDVIPGEEVEPQDMVEFVNVWRSRLRSELGSDTEILIGGLPGFRADYQNAVSGWFPVVVLLVVSGTFLALALSFRSLLIPLKALVLNLSSVAAGFGIVKLVFQDGLALSALGLSTPVSSVFPVIPTLVFCTVFGLSMDYEVFLVARVAEFKRAGFEEHDAIARGLAHSAPLITSAAAIMVVVFGAFALGQFLVIKMLGLALAASVFIDATLVRVAVGPALLTLAGRWNWWPGNRVVHHA